MPQKRHIRLPSLPVWFVVASCLLLVILVWLVAFPHAAASSVELVYGTRHVTLETVSTPSALGRGLGGRASLPQDAGMLFVFDKPDIYPFWMKDMRFPIDIVWTLRGKVVDVTTLQPPQTGGQIPTYTPRNSADRVIELNAGQAEQLGLTIGSSVGLR